MRSIDLCIRRQRAVKLLRGRARKKEISGKHSALAAEVRAGLDLPRVVRALLNASSAYREMHIFDGSFAIATVANPCATVHFLFLLTFFF